MIYKTPETELTLLLRHMSPELSPEIYVYASLDLNYQLAKELNPLLIFREIERQTIILPKIKAEYYGIDYTFPCNVITLNVHSALNAVGFLALILSRLAQNNIPVNAISAYYHDHLLVPVDNARHALDILQSLSEEFKIINA